LLIKLIFVKNYFLSIFLFSQIIIQTGLLPDLSIIFAFTTSQDLAQFFHFSGTKISLSFSTKTNQNSQLSLYSHSNISLSSSNIFTITASSFHLCFCNLAFT
jgi:hypothetical protein